MMTCPTDIDPQCRDLVMAMNTIPGITTRSSCCGHGERKYLIFFDAADLKCLPHLVYWFAVCHCGFNGWLVRVTTDCAKDLSFVVEGPVGTTAYVQSRTIAALILQDQDSLIRLAGTKNEQKSHG